MQENVSMAVILGRVSLTRDEGGLFFYLRYNTRVIEIKRGIESWFVPCIYLEDILKVAAIELLPRFCLISMEKMNAKYHPPPPFHFMNSHTN
ncbi:hypothetical protein L1987_41586 [Smallanthus sonchifolius]|uniref:Uncharacterized protein n=1 Tax=Smallanthus sonchifolius TaxID=185202 RepID=A0ACB9GUQ2_9ASTR|nr:hypothetical protein L1987_41586 [Smallanthus sonchifolius]